MTTRTIKTISQNVAARIGVKVPSSLVGNTEQTAQRLLAAVRDTGQELVELDWKVLIFEHTFDTVSGTLEYTLSLNPTFESLCGQAWDRTTFRPLHGPITPTYYQNRVSSLQAASGIFKNFMLRADSSRTLKFTLTDDPAGVFTIAFDYKTSDWLENAGTYSADISSDSQSPVFDAGLFELGVRWRTLDAMGRPYGDAYREYTDRLDNKLAQDGNAEVLDLAPKMFVLPGAENVPETGFGS